MLRKDGEDTKEREGYPKVYGRQMNREGFTGYQDGDSFPKEN